MKVLSLSMTGNVYEICIKRWRWWIWPVEERWIANVTKRVCPDYVNVSHPNVREHRRWMDSDHGAPCALNIRIDQEVDRIEEFGQLNAGMQSALDEVIDLDSERTKRKKGRA